MSAIAIPASDLARDPHWEHDAPAFEDLKVVICQIDGRQHLWSA